MYFIGAVQLIAVAASLTLGLTVFLKNRSCRVNRYFAMFSAGVAGWNATLFLALYSPGDTLLWSRAVFSFWALTVTGLFLFASEFFSEGRQPKSSHDIAIALGLFIFAAALTNLIVRRAAVVDHSYITVDLVPMPLLLYMAYYFGLTLVSYRTLFKKYRAANGAQKIQLQYVLWGIALFFAPVFLIQIILPRIFNVFNLNYLGPLFSIPMVALIAYAIVRHQLMDIRIVVRRGTVYAALFAIIIGFYISAVLIMGYIFDKTSDITALFGGATATIVGIVTVPYIERFFRRITDRIFFKDKYDYSAAVYRLSEILNNNLDLETLLASATRALEDIFRARQASFVLSTNTASSGARRETPLCDREMRGIAVPIALGEKYIGAVALSEKRSGDPYTEEDVTLLKTFSYQAAVAIEKAQLYQKVKDHSRELEARVRERTAKLQELQEGQRQMALDISHGLQTPLTVVKCEIASLRKQLGSRGKRAQLEVFDHSIDKVSRFIYDLLKLAKLESGEECFEKEPLDLSGFVRDILEYVHVIASEKRITITSRIENGVRVSGRKEKLEESIVNLVSNAVKYTESARRKAISVTLRNAGRSAELTIEDTGAGISPEDLPHIFERFYKAKQYNGTIVKGTGLGLAISKKIIEKHGGTIEAESKLGAGTKFTVRLPLV
ncbi:MAG TPA: ATP-binding protein [Candidatus Paceibacterota bacterium]|nr:ATP-binding protein [Candidatus Paceibacterota bacterium]